MSLRGLSLLLKLPCLFASRLWNGSFPSAAGQFAGAVVGVHEGLGVAFLGCTASPLVLERGAHCLLRAQTPALEASFLGPCSIAGGFFVVFLRFFCDFLKLATVNP